MKPVLKIGLLYVTSFKICFFVKNPIFKLTFLVNRPAFNIYKNEMFYIMYAPDYLDLPKLA